MGVHTIVMALALAGAERSLPADEGRALSIATLTPQDRGLVRAGRVVAKVIETEDRTEVLSVAALQTAMDLDRLLECARSALGPRRAEDSLGEARLTSPPRLSDFVGLRLDEGDLEALARCRVGDCRVRLTADAISELSDHVHGSTRRGEQLERAFRAMLTAEALAYLARGRASLLPYGDGPDSVHRAEGLAELLRRPLYLLEAAGDLADYLSSYPARRPRLVDEFLSWRQERFWRKPVIGLYHTMIWEAFRAGERRLIVASKQFYASHYFESGVEILEARKRTGDALAEISFVSRVRTDVRPSGFSWLERVLLRRLVRGRLEEQFGQLRERLAGTGETRTRAVENSLGGSSELQ